jgi:hypothetical protein
LLSLYVNILIAQVTLLDQLSYSSNKDGK